MDAETLCFTPATELAARIRRREVSPVDVVEAFLDRIAARNDAVNAYVTVAADEARARAAAAERALDGGRDIGPLHGVPVALKDLSGFKAGVRNTFGSLLFEDYVPDRSEAFVERLEAAGAVVLGKTNTPEFGLGTTTDNRLVGPTHTPFDLDRNAGGSSGGSAAAVADGLAAVAQGSDAGGSIRIPASFCGVFGIKPTFGRVPKTVSQRPNAFARHTPYSQFGPLARTVEDAALMLDVMAGPHPRDPFTLPDDGCDYLAATRRSVADLDIAYSPDFGIYPVRDDVRAVVEDAVDALATTGAAVTAVDVDFGHSQDDVLGAFYAYARVLWPHVLENLATAHGVDPFGADRDKLRPVLVETLFEGDPVSAAEYKAADRVRTAVYDAVQDVFDEYDLLVTPTLGVTAFDAADPPTEIGGREIEPLRGWVLTQPYNLTGHPAASVPAGLTDAGLPVGLQIAGRRFADDVVLAASAALERIRPWQDAYPRE